MTKVEIGNFCSHCSKTVIDFTNLSDKDVLKIIEQNPGRLCGRLNEEQLNRVINLYKPTNNSRLYKLLVGLMLLGTNKSSLATVNKSLQHDNIHIVDTPKIKLTETKSKPRADTLKNNIQGTVIDSKTKDPIPFASIIIKGTKIGTLADVNGKFKLFFPDSLIVNKFYLSVASVGYENIDIQVDKTDLPINIEINSVPSRQVIVGEVVVVKKKKWWQRKKKSSH